MLSKNEHAPCTEEGQTMLNIKHMDKIDCSFFSFLRKEKCQRKSIPFQDPKYKNATRET